MSKSIPSSKNGSKQRARSKDSMQSSIELSRRSGPQYDKRGRAIPTRLVKAPRPQPPWRVAAARAAAKANKKKRVGSKARSGLLGALGKNGGSKDKSADNKPVDGGLNGEDVNEEESEDEPEPQTPATLLAKRKRQWCQRTGFPCCIFTLGFLLLTLYLAFMVDSRGRVEGTCAVAAFKQGTDCRDCVFEVDVTGPSGQLSKRGVFKLAFDKDGKVDNNDAFEQCGSTDCCTFSVVRDRETIFCDKAPWDCHYKLGRNGGPLDLKYGSMQQQMFLLYGGLALLALIWPIVYSYKAVLDKKYATQVAQGLQQMEANRQQAALEAQQQQNQQNSGILSGMESV